MQEPELREKFLDCTRAALGENRAVSLYESLRALPAAPSLRELPLASVH